MVIDNKLNIYPEEFSRDCNKMGTIFDIDYDTIAVTSATSNSIYICKPDSSFSLEIPQKGIKKISIKSKILVVLAGFNSIYYAMQIDPKEISESNPITFPNKETKFSPLNLPPILGEIHSIYAHNKCILIIANNRITNKKELWSYPFEKCLVHCQGGSPKLNKFTRCCYPEYYFNF